MPYDFHGNMYGNHSTHAHIPHTPAWLLPIRILQGLLALITLALSAFVIDTFGSGFRLADRDGPGLNIWTSILTFITLAYIFITGFRLAHFYNNWAVLVLEVLCVIFWSITFSVLGSNAKDGNDLKDYYRVRGRLNDALNSLTAAAALSALNFVLFCITLAVFTQNFHRHRQAGHPTVAAGGVGSHKMNPVNPATGTEQQYGNAGVGAGQQYPPATHSQPAYNQQGHQAV